MRSKKQKVSRPPLRLGQHAAAKRARHAGRGRQTDRQAAQAAHREIGEGLRLECVDRPAGIIRGLHAGRRERPKNP